MRLRTVMAASMGAFLLLCAWAATVPVQAVGTGNCDPFDAACLRANNLYGADICAATNTTCLTTYQSLGISVCNPTNAVCTAAFAGVIGRGSSGTGGTNAGFPTVAPASFAGGVSGAVAPTPYMTGGFASGSPAPIFTISTPTAVKAPLSSSTAITGTPVPAGKYGIDLCAATDTNCLLTQQQQGVPICPPDDAKCRETYVGVYKPLQTFAPASSATVVPEIGNTGGSGASLPRYVVGGSDAAANTSGVIVVYNK